MLFKIIGSILMAIISLLSMTGNVVFSVFNNTPVSGYFGNVNHIFDFFEPHMTEPNISFSMFVNSSIDIDTHVSNASIFIYSKNITLSSSTMLNFHRPIIINSFDGEFTFYNSTLILKGEAKKISMADVEITGETKISKSTVKVDEVRIEPLYIDKLSFRNKKGKITAADVSFNTVNHSVEITKIKGSFSLGSNLTIDGKFSELDIENGKKISIR